MRWALLVVGLAACSDPSSPVRRYAVGAADEHRAATPCTITGNAAGALVARADQTDDRGLDVEAIKPGTARIDCGRADSVNVEVREAVRIELGRADGRTDPLTAGIYAPDFCVVAFDAEGHELEVGNLVQGAEFVASDQLTRVVDHGMGAALRAHLRNDCSPEHMAHSPGAGTVSVQWRGLSATTGFEIKLGP